MAKKETNKISRGMPYSAEAEAAVLGSALIDDVAANEVLPKLKEGDFFIDKHRLIFKEMAGLQLRSVPIDVVTVADALELAGKLDEVGSIAYLSELAESVISSANAAHYAEIIRRDSLTRKVIHAGNQIVQNGYEAEDGEKALSEAERLVYGIAEEESDRELVKADVAFAAAMNDIQEAQVGANTDRFVYSGFPKLDRATKGLKPGELILIAARPSVGKTAFALNIAVNVALGHDGRKQRADAQKDGKSVAIFSLEMDAPLLAKRMLAYESGVSFNAMDRVGGLSSGESGARLMSAYKRLSAAKIFIDDYSLNSPNDILSKCRRLKREQGLDLIVVDYLQLMKGNASSSRGFESRQVEVSDMSRMMKVYAKELGCPIVLLSQMSRSVEQRQGKPMLSDLRESGAIEQDADVVAFLHNPSKYNAALPPDQVLLCISKNRNGPLDEITLQWTGETTTFKEMEDDEAAAKIEQAKREHAEQESPKPKAPKVKPIAEAEQPPTPADSAYQEAASDSDQTTNDAPQSSDVDQSTYAEHDFAQTAGGQKPPMSLEEAMADMAPVDEALHFAVGAQDDPNPQDYDDSAYSGEPDEPDYDDSAYSGDPDELFGPNGYPGDYED